MMQPGLFDQPVRARARDPETSQIAAARVSEFADGHNALILGGLHNRPSTIHELASRIDLHNVAIARRMAELATAGRVQVQKRMDGQVVTRKGPSGRPCRVWMLAE